MKIKTTIQPCWAIATLLISGGQAYGGSFDIPPPEKYEIISYQQDYKIKTERVMRTLSTSHDQWIDFRDTLVSDNEGIQIAIGKPYLKRDGYIEMDAAFDCDYTKGETSGMLLFSYQTPWAYNNKLLHASLSVTCHSMSEDDIQRQIKEEEEVRATQAAAEEKRTALQRKKDEELKQAELEKAIKSVHDAKCEKLKNEYYQTTAYKRREAVEMFKSDKEQLRHAREAMDNERKIGEVSGYVDKTRLHGLGSMIVFLEARQKELRKIYRQNGGKNNRIEDATEELPPPLEKCEF